MARSDRSHWFDAADAYRPDDPLTEQAHADVCVIGGGITGLSAACHLRQADPGASVALLEGDVVGFGASGRNAGQLIVAFGDSDFRAQLRRFGAERLRQAHAYVHEGIGTIERLIDEHAIACDYQPTGYLWMGLRSDDSRRLADYMAFSRTIGQDDFLQAVSGPDVAREFDSPYFGAACFDRRGGQINPLKLVRGLKRAAQALGADIYEHSAVTDIERDAGGITVRTRTGSVRCTRLVLATNAYSHLLPGLQKLAVGRDQYPVFVHANVTEPLTQQQWRRLKWPRRCGVNLMADLFYSFAPTADGRLLYVGGYHVGVPGGEAMAPADSKGFMTTGPAHLAAFFPALAGLGTAASWGGPISTTRDYVPHVGVLDDARISYASGCWGHGLPLGANNGRTLAELALGLDTERTRSWLVTREKSRWPGRAITPLILRGVAAAMRYGIRRTARRMDARLTFDD